MAAWSGICWACHDVGANTAAQRYIEVALRCAGKAGDWELYADSYSNLSRMLVHGGDGDQSCLAAVRRAEEHFASAVPANETTIMLDFFSSAQLASDSGYALLPLAMRGQHVATTVELLRTAAESYPIAKARPRVLAELRLSSLLFAQGDPAEAVAVATSALVVADPQFARCAIPAVAPGIDPVHPEKSPELAHPVLMRAHIAIVAR